jgi:polyhydroxybutyrate depolymerase
MMRALGAVLCVSLIVGCGGSSEDDLKSGSGGKKNDAGTGGAAGSGTGGSAGAIATGGSAGTVATGGAAGAGTGGAPTACSLPVQAPGTSDIQVTSSGEQRKARVVVPPSYDGTVNVPLVLVFHGYLGNPVGIEEVTKMKAVAEQHGVIAVYPEGLNTSWNAGKCCGTSSSVNRPDVQFVSDLLDALEAKYCVDPKRIYSTGFSNGGMFSNRLGCELTSRIAAIAPVAGPRAVDTCNPTRFLPVIEFHGTNDLIVPWGGQAYGSESVDVTTAFWKNNGACIDAEPTQVFQNGDTTCVEYSQCQGGVAVRLCKIEGGGHQWPGGGPNGGIGKQTQDISASEELMKFFLAHPMP